MKPNKIRFEFLKTNKGNFVINYDSPDVGFNLHGKPEYVKQMYVMLRQIYPKLPEAYTFMSNQHLLVETEGEYDT